MIDQYGRKKDYMRISVTDRCNLRCDMLSQTYEAEQKKLEAEAITLQQEIEVQEWQNENIEKFIQKAHKYVSIEELDGYALRELVSAIYVDAPDSPVESAYSTSISSMTGWDLSR